MESAGSGLSPGPGSASGQAGRGVLYLAASSADLRARTALDRVSRPSSRPPPSRRRRAARTARTLGLLSPRHAVSRRRAAGSPAHLALGAHHADAERPFEQQPHANRELNASTIVPRFLGTRSTVFARASGEVFLHDERSVWQRALALCCHPRSPWTSCERRPAPDRSPSRSCIRERQQRRADCSYPCNAALEHDPTKTVPPSESGPKADPGGALAFRMACRFGASRTKGPQTRAFCRSG